jgi:NADH:ubiquinone oxidoreductase subunit F (NADH-binding)
MIAELEAAGLRGRGGAGFPTGTKWRTVVANRSPMDRTTVVVNGAEGEPGTLKDRTILRTNPYPVLEGALIAARAVDSDEVIVAVKRSFGPEVARLRAAVAEVQGAGWAHDVRLRIFEGPNEYLYGEETALLETLDGRYPLPRIAPPYRRGVHEVVETAADATAHSALSAHVEMAGPGGESVAAPTLVDNVETLANVPRIIERGARWFRTEGTPESPGTIVCTVIGSVQRPGVGEVIMGTPLGEAIEAISGGPRSGRRLKAVLPGVSAGVVPASLLDTPLAYETMAAVGSGLGSAGFIVLDDHDDMAAMAAGASRFLAVESCGQCTPCKQDGLALSDLLARLSRSQGGGDDLAAVRDRLVTVADRARCALAGQQQTVVGSILERFGDELEAHASGEAAGGRAGGHRGRERGARLRPP